MRTRQVAEWDKDSKEALFVRGLATGRIRLKDKVTSVINKQVKDMSRSSHKSRKSPIINYDTIRSFENRPAEVRANIIICLIHQTNYLLDQQIRRLEQDFLAEGGLRERMTRARIESRHRQKTTKQRRNQ